MDKFTKKKHSKQEIDPAIVGIVGSVIGVALGTAATIYLSKEENRSTLFETLSKLKAKTQKLFNRSLLKKI